jgi:putative addiction module killer protein
LYILRPREIELYETASGRTPFTEWIERLAFNVQRIIYKRLDRIALGNFGDTKSLGDGVYELRFDTGPGYRVYYGLDGDTIVLLLSGGDKSTQVKDIKQAKEYWNEYKYNREKKS